MKEQITKIEEVNDREAGFVVTTTEQVIELLIDNVGDCCESWGWFWSNDNPQDFIGAELLGVEVVDTALNVTKLEAEHADSRDEGGIMFVNLKTAVGVLQFTAYNSHNGYYGHTASVKSKQLNYETCL